MKPGATNSHGLACGQIKTLYGLMGQPPSLGYKECDGCGGSGRSPSVTIVTIACAQCSGTGRIKLCD